MRVVIKWENERLFTFKLFWWDPYVMNVIDSRVNNSLLSYFMITLTLQVPSPRDNLVWVKLIKISLDIKY